MVDWAQNMMKMKGSKHQLFFLPDVLAIFTGHAHLHFCVHEGLSLVLLSVWEIGNSNCIRRGCYVFDTKKIFFWVGDPIADTASIFLLLQAS